MEGRRRDVDCFVLQNYPIWEQRLNNFYPDFFWPVKMTLRLVHANATCRCQKKACETDFLRTLILVAKFIYLQMYF